MLLLFKFHFQGFFSAIGEILIARTIDSQYRPMTHSQKLLIQLVDQIGTGALPAKQSIEIAFDVGLVREAKQIEKVGIDLHVFDVVKTLRQEEHIQFVVMAIHGEKLVEAFTLTSMFQSHDTYIINDHVGMRLNVHVLDAVRHGAVVLEVLDSLSVLIRGRIGNDHHALGLSLLQ